MIPNRPWKNITAALFSALMVPCAHLLCASVLGYPAMPWNRLAAYSLSPLFIAAWAPFLSTRIYRMQQDLGRAADLGVTGSRACSAKAEWAKCGARATVFYAGKRR